MILLIKKQDKIIFLMSKIISKEIYIKVYVKSNKKNFEIQKKNNHEYTVFLTSRPIDNKCNEELIKELSIFFNISKSNISITRGLKNRTKFLKIIQ